MTSIKRQIKTGPFFTNWISMMGEGEPLKRFKFCNKTPQKDWLLYKTIKLFSLSAMNVLPWEIGYVSWSAPDVVLLMEKAYLDLISYLQHCFAINFLHTRYRVTTFTKAMIRLTWPSQINILIGGKVLLFQNNRFTGYIGFFFFKSRSTLHILTIVLVFYISICYI